MDETSALGRPFDKSDPDTARMLELAHRGGKTGVKQPDGSWLYVPNGTLTEAERDELKRLLPLAKRLG